MWTQILFHFMTQMFRVHGVFFSQGLWWVGSGHSESQYEHEWAGRPWRWKDQEEERKACQTTCMPHTKAVFLTYHRKIYIFSILCNLAFLFPLTPGTQQEASEVTIRKGLNGSPAGAEGQWNGSAEWRGGSRYSVWSGQTGKERDAGIKLKYIRENWSTCKWA